MYFNYFYNKIITEKSLWLLPNIVQPVHEAKGSIMSEIQIKKGTIIYQQGTPLTSVSLLSEGTVQLNLPCENLQLHAGDALGILDLNTGVHSCDYIAVTDIIVDSFPYKSPDSLLLLFGDDPDLTRDFYLSSLKMITAVMDLCQISKYTCDSLYASLMEYYRDYCKLCKQYQIPAKTLPGFENAEPLEIETKPDSYLRSYYLDCRKIGENEAFRSLFEKTGFVYGFLLRVSADLHLLLRSCEEMEQYLADLSCLLMNEEHIDFLDLFTSLLITATQKGEDTLSLTAAISRLFIRSQNVHSVGQMLYNKRLSEYKQLTSQLSAIVDARSQEQNQEQVQISDRLKHSLAIILDFAQMEPAFCKSYTALVDEYKSIVDKTSLSEDLCQLREQLSEGFYDIYREAFFRSMHSSDLPAVVRMFLYFGYMDEELCGLESASYLYGLQPDVSACGPSNIYLFYDWLRLIYEGKKQPRRDEFDQDYPAFVQAMVNDGKITKEKASELLNDTTEKVIFELNNLFRCAGKMTYGRIQTFCPLLSEHDFIKTPEETLLGGASIQKAFDEIRMIDFSAFCREVMFTDPILGNGYEMIDQEILPDIILMPNIGTRGVLWQEIEGRNRSTPGCMLFPVFCLTDIRTLALRLTGEFRWEMCKRMQGSRWNDVTSQSLTSEYFDYLQFYKKNKDLSPEAKEKCRMQLQRSKSRFRESFILDYITWITYESKGTPHLNKVTRKIFMTYCPFSSPYREALKKNPFYASLIEKYETHKNKELTRISHVITRIQRNGKGEIPPRILQQAEFLKR